MTLHFFLKYIFLIFNHLVDFPCLFVYFSDTKEGLNFVLSLFITILYKQHSISLEKSFHHNDMNNDKIIVFLFCLFPFLQHPIIFHMTYLHTLKYASSSSTWFVCFECCLLTWWDHLQTCCFPFISLVTSCIQELFPHHMGMW